MNHIVKRLIISLPMAAGLIMPTLAMVPVSALDSGAAAGTDKATTNTTATSDATRLTNIKTKGDAEITRRLNTLSKLSAKISSAAKLSAADKATLTAEVATETANLTALKTKLASETTVAGAVADVTSMVSDYRVYALVVPKIALVKTADDQLVVEGKLNDLATKLQTRITTSLNAGKEVTTLQTQLTDMQMQITAAQTISTSIQTQVIALQPTDYNSDHTILSGDANQLKTAHADNQAAYNDAKSIVASLKTL